MPRTDRLEGIRAEIAVIGSGPGGAVVALELVAAGHDVLLIEEGPDFPLESAPHFSREEILQKYRNGGINLALGKAKVAYVEGRCVGGGSEINRGLYHRAPPEVLEEWRHDFKVEALTPSALGPHFEACEQTAPISLLPGEAPMLSRRLYDGATALGWSCIEVPRLFRYASPRRAGSPGTKQSMSVTFIPRFRAAGGRLLADTRVRRLMRTDGGWQLQAEQAAGGGPAADRDLRRERVRGRWCGADARPAAPLRHHPQCR